MRIPAPPPNSTAAEIAKHYARALRRLEHGVRVPERGFFRLQGAADDPHTPISGDVLLTHAGRQRRKIPIYSLTTGQPLPDVKGERASDAFCTAAILNGARF